MRNLFVSILVLAALAACAKKATTTSAAPQNVTVPTTLTSGSLQ